MYAPNTKMNYLKVVKPWLHRIGAKGARAQEGYSTIMFFRNIEDMWRVYHHLTTVYGKQVISVWQRPKGDVRWHGVPSISEDALPSWP
jgi:hypothetical protein